MNKALASCISILALCFTIQPLWAAPAAKIQASYDVMGFGMKLAKITETYTRNDDNYQIESVTTAVGLLARFKPETVRVISQGKLTPNGLMPLNFSLTRELDKDKNASAKFNWDKSTLTHYDYKGVNDLPLSSGTQDRLSILYHLPMLASKGLAAFKFAISDGNNMENYQFALAAETQSIQVPLGEFSSRHISSTPAGEQVRYEIWMATERDYFPLKVIVTDSAGGKLTQVLTELTITP